MNKKNLQFSSLILLFHWCIAWGNNPGKITGEFDTLNIVESDPNAIALDSRNRAEAVTIIDAEQLRGRSNSLNDIIDRVAGLKVRQTGGLGSTSRLSIHGLEGKRVKIYLDGSPIDAPDGNFGINDIPVDFIERVEIYKGYVPARFGSDGIGGVVNIVIREFNTNYLDGSYSLGSYTTHRATWVLKHNFDNLRLELGTGGFFNYSANDYEFKDPHTPLKVTSDHDVYRSFVPAIAGKLKDYFFDEIKWEIAWYNNYKDTQERSKRILYAHTKSQTALIATEFRKKIGNLTMELSPVFAVMEGNNIDTSHVWYPDWTQIKPNVSTGKPHGEIGDGPNNSSAKQKDLRAQLLLEYRINDKQLLTWNTNGRGAWFKNRDSLADAAAGRTVSGYPGKLYTAVSGLSLESELFDDRLVNLAGLKLYHYRYRVTESFQGLAASLVTNYDKKTSVGFSESFRLTIVKPLFFNAGYQHSLRIPDKDELFGDGAFITPNSKLKAESADNFHAGFLFDSWDFPFLTRAQLDVHGFCYFIKDMIRLKSNGMMSMAYYNVENVRILGTDAELKVDFTDWLYAWSNLTLQNPVCTKSSESSTLAGKQVPNIPTFFVNFGAELCKEGLFVHHGFGKLFWSGGYTEDFYFNWKTTSQSRSRMIPSSFTMDAGIEYSLFDTKLSFCAEVRNITGKETFDEYNTPLPGRSFALKVRGSFVK